MTLTMHATLGGVIGAAVGTPVAGFAFGFLSHLLVDMIPHGDSGIADNFFVKKTRRKHAVAYVACDAVVAILFVLFLINHKNIGDLRVFAWGVAGGVVPDLLVGIHTLSRKRYLAWFNRLHFAFHDVFIKRHGDIPLPLSLAGQLVVILLLHSWL